MIPQKEKSEIVNHFQKEGYLRQIISDTINRMQLGRTINDKNKTGRPISWIPARKNELKRLTNKVQGSQLGHLYKRMLRETLASFHL